MQRIPIIMPLMFLMFAASGMVLSFLVFVLVTDPSLEAGSAFLWGLPVGGLMGLLPISLHTVLGGRVYLSLICPLTRPLNREVRSLYLVPTRQPGHKCFAKSGR